MLMISLLAFSQKMSAAYLDAGDNTKDYYLAVIPEDMLPGAFMVPGISRTPSNGL